MLRFLQDALDLILGQNDPHQREPAAKIRLDHEPNAGKSRHPRLDRYRGVLHAGTGNKLCQFLRISEHEWRTQRICRVFTREPFQ